MQGPDIHDEQRAMFQEKLEKIYDADDFPTDSLVHRRANGIYSACRAIGDAVIDMVPEGDRQNNALEAVLTLLENATEEFKNNPPKEEE